MRKNGLIALSFHTLVILFVISLADLRKPTMRLLRIVIIVLRSIVCGSEVNVEFYAGDSSASLAFEMQMAIVEVQL